MDSDDLSLKPSGREPELSGEGLDRAPMLGGSRRIWPSVSAYLLTKQHQAMRDLDMELVWAYRWMRYSIRMKLLDRQEASILTGEQVDPITDSEALDIIKQHRGELEEELQQANQYRRMTRAKEIRNGLKVIDDVVQFWEARLDST